MTETITRTVPTNLSNAIDAGLENDLRLDTYAKNVLADIQVLSYLLKYATTEFADMTLEEVQNSIEPDGIRVSEVRVEPGLTNIQSIQGDATESNIPNEGCIYFDIVFRAKAADDVYEIVINVEAQKTSDAKKLKYHIENRMIFYIARLVSSQKQVDFEKSNYDDMKKVKSVWICMDSDVDSIVRYRMIPEVVYGSIDQIPEADRIEGIVIRIRTNGNYEESKNQLIAMLEHLFQTTSIEDKKQILMKDGIKITKTLERSIDDMCNYSALVREKGVEQGRTEGLEQGRTEGLE